MQLEQVKLFFEVQAETYKRIEDEGVIMSIGDGIVKACGLSITAGEMVIMGSKGVKNMALSMFFKVKNCTKSLKFRKKNKPTQLSLPLFLFRYTWMSYKFCKHNYKALVYLKMNRSWYNFFKKNESLKKFILPGMVITYIGIIPSYGSIFWPIFTLHIVIRMIYTIVKAIIIRNKDISPTSDQLKALDGIWLGGWEVLAGVITAGGGNLISKSSVIGYKYAWNSMIAKGTKITQVLPSTGAIMSIGGGSLYAVEYMTGEVGIQPISKTMNLCGKGYMTGAQSHSNYGGHIKDSGHYIANYVEGFLGVDQTSYEKSPMWIEKGYNHVELVTDSDWADYQIKNAKSIAEDLALKKK